MKIWPHYKIVPPNEQKKLINIQDKCTAVYSYLLFLLFHLLSMVNGTVYKLIKLGWIPVHLTLPLPCSPLLSAPHQVYPSSFKEVQLYDVQLIMTVNKSTVWFSFNNNQSYDLKMNSSRVVSEKKYRASNRHCASQEPSSLQRKQELNQTIITPFCFL